MKDNIHHIHPGYEIMADLLEDENFKSGVAQNRYSLKNFQDEGRSLRPRYKKERPKYLWHFIAFYMTSIFGLCFLPYPRTAATPLPSFLNSKEERIIAPEKNDIENEISLIKEVLTNLTLTVERLSKQKENKGVESIKVEEFKPSLITVTSPKANLRETPSKDAKTLAVVQKDATLMGVGYQDGWIKTYAPSGKEAWVNSSLISRLEEEK